MTVARAALAAPQPLRFKDDVFMRDHIATAEKSVVRVLLGGKALVTVRELSSLTIKEETGRSTVDLTAGKIAMGVLRQRMRPGEVIEIRTPNAIAAIRGTVLVVELIPAPGGSPGQPSYTTKVHVLHGLVEVSDPKNPGAPAAQVGALQSWSRTGSEPFSQAPLSPTAAEHVFADLRSAPQIADGPAEFMATVTTREQAKAVAVAEFLAPEMAGAGAGGDSAPAAPPGAPGQRDAGHHGRARRAAACASAQPGARPGHGSHGAGAVLLQWPGRDRARQPLLADRGPDGFFGGADPRGARQLPERRPEPDGRVGRGRVRRHRRRPAALPRSLEAERGQRPDARNGGAAFSLTGTLFHDQNGGLGLSSDIMQITGGASFIGSGAAALVDLVGSSASAAGSLLSVSGGAVMDLVRASAPLLSLTQRAALTTDRSLVEVSSGAAVKLSQMAALTASSLTIKGHALSLTGGATMSVAGDLFRIANGSTLTLTNGALLSLSGGSTLNITGALINFIGTGNTLSITNGLCGNGGCFMIGNLPVFVAGGGTVNLGSNPILNLAGNTLDIKPGSAVISVTGGAQVKQGL